MAVNIYFFKKKYIYISFSIFFKEQYFFLGFLVFPSAPIYVLTLKLDDL